MTIKEYLTLAGISRPDFARSIDVTETTLTRYLGGQRMPDWPVIERIYRVTGGTVTPNDLLFERMARAKKSARKVGRAKRP